MIQLNKYDRHKLLIWSLIISIFIASLVASWVFIWHMVDDQNNHLMQQEEQLHKLQKFQEHLRDNPREFIDASNEAMIVQEKIPTELHMEKFMSQLASLATKYHLEIASCEPGTITTKEDVKLQTLQLVIVGQFGDIYKFATNINHLNRFLTYQMFDIAKDDNSSKIILTLHLTIYSKTA